jgi:carboxyl-terminal processing protease
VVELLSFSNGAHGLLRREVDRLEDKGAEGFVLDLRGNGGGLLSEGVLVSSIFIEDGKIVSVRGRNRPERTQDAQGDAIDEKIPVVTLVDGGSASASEIVTGALRDRDRAKVVGTRTFGKGLVQEVQRLSNGGVLDITVANYYLPGGETISARGIKPQIRAADDPDTDRDEALPVALDTLARELR